jgi:uncharacterized protein YlxW (UPF0749 family)
VSTEGPGQGSGPAPMASVRTLGRIAVSRYRSLPSWQVTLAVALLGLGFLVAAQLGSEGPRARYTSQERSPLIDTVLRLQQDQAALRARLAAANDRLTALESQGPDAATEARQLDDALDTARLSAGLTPVAGPGLVFRLEDPASGVPDGLVTAGDVRNLVDELWLAGAEAVSVNGERVTSATAILDIGSSILVNSAYLAPPYTISAIGPPDLYDRVRASAGFVDFVRSRVERYGMGLSVAEFDDLTLPAYAGVVRVRFGQPIESPAP